MPADGRLLWRCVIGHLKKKHVQMWAMTFREKQLDNTNKNKNIPM